MPVQPKPTEPERTQWVLPNPYAAQSEQELLGLGADLAPGTMLAGYRSGLFPMKVDMPDASNELGWWSPNPRGTLVPSDVKVSRSLQRSMKKFEITSDQAFTEVVEQCADPSRPHGWIDPDFQDAYGRLHQLGWAHSIEVWKSGPSADDERLLAGGLFGIQTGGLFAAESKFHRVTDASKVAVVALARHLEALPQGDQRLIDTQWPTEHLESLGVKPMARTSYLNQLERLASIGPDW